MVRAGRSQEPKAKKDEVQRDWLDYVASYAATVSKVCFVLFVVALGYILYAVYGGYLSQAVDARVVGNIALMGKVLAVAGTVGTLAFALATMGEVAYMVAAGIIGLGLIFGTPMLILSKLTNQSNPAVGQAISEWTRNAGWGICAIALLRVLYHIGYIIKTGPEARRRAELEEEDRLGPKKVKRSTGIYAPCWGLPYCHETIREVCPAFKEHKSCWKIERGCNCDPTLVESMIRSGAARVGKGQDKTSARSQQTQDAYMRELLGAGKTGPGGQARTIDCKKCPIYGEHQRQKFNIANPIAIIGTIVLLVLAYAPLKQIYDATIQGLAKSAAQFTFSQEADPGKWVGYLDSPAVQVFFFTIVGLFILAYVLKIVEWAIFVKKL